MSAAVKIWQTFCGPYGSDWMVECDGTCPRPLHLGTGDWADAFDAGVGHALLHHPRR